MKLVESRTATLDTLSVTIHALHVSGKQMTLAVFRQLPEGEETAASDLWGVVHYPIKDSQPLWLVFSDQGILKKRNLANLRRPGYADDPQEKWADYDMHKMAAEINRLKGKILSAFGSEEYRAKAATEREQEISKLTAKYWERKKQLAELRCQELDDYHRDTRMSRLTQLYIAV